ncbi:MAG: class I SAM-dependent methyltransferase [Cyanobacteria bacterium P01_F01_bin.150]
MMITNTQSGQVKLSLAEISRLRAQFWKQGYGSISANEAVFIQDAIIQEKPKRFLEVGTASGLSTGLISIFMDLNDGEDVITIDLDETFWVDRSKSVGFLATEMYQEDKVKVTQIKGKTSTCLSKTFAERKFDMAFVDACHQHPWPTLDMLSIVPLLNSGSFVIHHDLALYKMHPIGIGPKHLYDQMPGQFLHATYEPRQNIYYIRVPSNYQVFETYLSDSLLIPWTIKHKIPDSTIGEFGKIIEQYWSSSLLADFNKSVNRFNK